MNGLILLDKPNGITSFAALGAIKEKNRTRRVGHTGTLDKFAGGLLPVLSGTYTRLAGFFKELAKSYRAVICFGTETATLDPEGEITARGMIPDGDSFGEALSAFRGDILQVPPRYSAVHVNGERAYRYALKGIEVKIEPRPVKILSIEIKDYIPPLLTLDITCSSGTYIRSLARDLAYKLGTCAHVSELIRLGIGPFTLDEAVTPEDYRPEVHLKPAVEFIKRLRGIGSLTVEKKYTAQVYNGARLVDAYFKSDEVVPGTYAIFDSGEKLMAVVDKHHDSYRYKLVVKE
jgi:tRNA pseudouridine55 synthase